MMLSYDSFDNAYQLSLNGELHHHVTLGTDARGNLTRIDNVLAGIEGRIETTRQKLDSLYQQQADAKAELGKPFPPEEELQEKAARLAELDAALNMDEPEAISVIGDGEPDEEICDARQVAEPKVSYGKPSVLAELKSKAEQISGQQHTAHPREAVL